VLQQWRERVELRRKQSDGATARARPAEGWFAQSPRRLATIAFTVVATLTALAATTPTTAHAASRSIGYPDAGHLVRGCPMPTRGPGFALQNFTRKHDLRWGMCSLVRTLRTFAGELRPLLAGHALMIGNLSQRGGGEMAHSQSHESGRDFDLGLLLCDDKGRPIPSYYHHFDRDGVSRSHGPRYRFDAARNWQLVVALVDNADLAIERIVIGRHLRAAMLAYAEASHVPAALRRRVAEKLIPPWPGVHNHDNHLHVRIACPQGDGADGRCRDRPLPAPASAAAPVQQATSGAAPCANTP
jgi:penicillin-insensitive murein endopeptidase